MILWLVINVLTVVLVPCYSKITNHTIRAEKVCIVNSKGEANFDKSSDKDLSNDTLTTNHDGNKMSSSEQFTDFNQTNPDKKCIESAASHIVYTTRNNIPQNTITAEDFANKLQSLLETDEANKMKPLGDPPTEMNIDEQNGSRESSINSIEQGNSALFTTVIGNVNNQTHTLHITESTPVVTEQTIHTNNTNSASVIHGNDSVSVTKTGSSSSDVWKNDTIKALNKMSEEIKTNSNNALMAWEEIKENVSQGTEAYHVLKDYLEKITISQSLNNTDCVQKDVLKYKTRQQKLMEALSECEKEIKRENWNKLQNLTKDTLNNIFDVIQDYESNVKFNDTTQSNNEYLMLKQHIVRDIGFETTKNTLVLLKETALKEDEMDLNYCVNVKTQSDVEGTLNDIMRIKNNCVG